MADNSTGSRQNLDLAKLWLQTCLSKHSKYGCERSPDSPPPLPTRVIDLQDLECPILRETCGLHHEYLTLSYCWGQGKRLLTEKKSGRYEKFRQKIPVDETMPKTFKEAFHATKALGYRYLWIDALCIIQDDFDDVQREMAQMGEIYRNSVLTISAASGSDTSSGLFIERDPRRYKPCNVTLMMMEGEERLQGIVSIHVFENEYENPLSKRGWVLQEEILSTRSLTFGPYGIRWRCMAESCNEARPQGCREDDVQNPIRYEQVTSLDNMRWLVRSADIFLKLEKPSNRRHNHFDAWYELVEAYSKRELTFMSDKLPAIAGLASLMAKNFSCTYGGGLWKEDLQIGLVWYVVGCESNSNPYYGPVECASDQGYIAPSWSWASMTNRQISFCHYEENSRCLPEEGVQILDWNFSYPEGTLAPFGQVKSGILTVKGQLRKAFLVPCLDSWDSEAQTKHFSSLW